VRRRHRDCLAVPSARRSLCPRAGRRSVRTFASANSSARHLPARGRSASSNAGARNGSDTRPERRLDAPAAQSGGPFRDANGEFASKRIAIAVERRPREAWLATRAARRAVNSSRRGLRGERCGAIFVDSRRTRWWPRLAHRDSRAGGEKKRADSRRTSAGRGGGGGRRGHDAGA